MSEYTFTIFDGNVNECGGTAWPDYTDELLEADSDEEARASVKDTLEVAAAGLNAADGYSVGDKLSAILCDDTIIVGIVHYTLTAEDLGIEKDSVRHWSTVASYVSTFSTGNDESACDVEVQIGKAGGVWFVRTLDDHGGGDDADDEQYSSEEDATEAAEVLAAEFQEAEDGETAEDYLARQLVERIGDPDPDGRWACYWESINPEDERVESRYATREQAEAATIMAQAQFRSRYPNGALCGYVVKELES